MLAKPVGIGCLAPLLESLSCVRLARVVDAAYFSRQHAMTTWRGSPLVCSVVPPSGG